MRSEEKAVALLKEKGLRVALAESCTGGAVAKRLTDVSGASSVFECGVVCYSNRIKALLLKVKIETLKEKGAVSRETARELAQGVRNLSGASIGVGITGMAGPTSDEPGKPVGLIFVSASDGASTLVTRLETGDSSEGCRERNRVKAAEEAFRLICELADKH